MSQLLLLLLIVASAVVVYGVVAAVVVVVGVIVIGNIAKLLLPVTLPQQIAYTLFYHFF